DFLGAGPVETHRVHRIRDVEQDAVARAGAGGEADFGKHRDVVALVGDAPRLRSQTAITALLETGDGAGLQVREDARPVDDLRLLGRRQRHLDHVDAEERGVRILFGVLARAAGELVAGAHGAGARAVDVDVGLVLRIGHQRVRVRAAAGLATLDT